MVLDDCRAAADEDGDTVTPMVWDDRGASAAGRSKTVTWWDDCRNGVDGERAAVSDDCDAALVDAADVGVGHSGGGEDTVGCRHPDHLNTSLWLKDTHACERLARIRGIMVTLAARVTSATWDNAAQMVRRVLAALDEDMARPQGPHQRIVDHPRQRPFSVCSACACKWRRVNMWGYRVWVLELRFDAGSTYAPWAQQVPPSAATRAACPGLAALFDDCVVMGMQADEHGLFIPGLQLPWRQFWIRSSESQEDAELVKGTREGWTFEFDDEHQPPIIGWDRDRVLQQWSSMSDENFDLMVRDFDRWAGIGEFEWQVQGQRQRNEQWKKWEGPLSVPPPTVTPQYIIEKEILEMKEDGTEVWTTDTRVISDLKASGTNEASQAESSTTYSTPQDFAKILVPNGAIVRADEPKAFTGKPIHWTEHSVVTCVRPASLREAVSAGRRKAKSDSKVASGDVDDDHVGRPPARAEQYYRACYWVFGGKHFPRLQMRYGRFVIRMLMAGFDGTSYGDTSVKAIPRALPDEWQCLIMDDYGDCVGHPVRDDGRYVWEEAKRCGDEKFDRIAGLQREGNLGQGIKVAKKIVHRRGPYGGREFVPFDPMDQMSTGGLGSAKVRKIQIIGKQVLATLDAKKTLTRRGWAQFMGLCNDAGPWSQMSHYFIEMVYIVWPRDKYPPEAWVRGDPSFRSDRKRHTLATVDWRPKLAQGETPSWEAPVNDEFETENGIVVRGLIERWIRELPDRACVPVFTGLPLPGLWRGQISQTTEELMALPRGVFHTVEGIPFVATDATLTRGGAVLGREVAVADFDGQLHVQHTEMRSLHMGCVHNEHELLPPSSQRAVIGKPTYIPAANRWTDEGRAAHPELAAAQPRYATRRTDLAYLAAGRVLGLQDNIGIVCNVNAGYSTNGRTNIDVRDAAEWRRARGMYLALIYINTSINVADLPTRFKMRAFTESVWFTDEIWDYLAETSGLNIVITAEAYADEQNARTRRWCSRYEPFGSSPLDGETWLVNMPWTALNEALVILETAALKGEDFDFVFVLAESPSLALLFESAEIRLEKLQSKKVVTFEPGQSVFEQKTTHYKVDSAQEHRLQYELGSQSCSPIPWRVHLWATRGVFGPS
jgi:hypothetical protein